MDITIKALKIKSIQYPKSMYIQKGNVATLLIGRSIISCNEAIANWGKATKLCSTHNKFG